MEILKLLFEHGANTKATEGTGRGPLGIAAIAGCTKVIMILLERPPSLSEKERSHASVLLP
jgi:hypothetical protein